MEREKANEEFRLGAQPNNIAQRKEQLKRWEQSETNREAHELKRPSPRIAFQRGCIFLATCSSGDFDEIRRQLDAGVDINTANVDGLTALHQACIDNNLDLVKFLLDCGANPNVQDNEGWTPLHAAANCGYLELTKFLIDHGAELTVVNSDGELALDLADNDDMAQFLRNEMQRHGKKAEDCRDVEQKLMLIDARNWLAQRSTEWLNVKDYKTGASPLHVAAAKGYQEVLEIFVQLGQLTGNSGFLEVRDRDGWTPLHAAAHWAHEEACATLVAAGASLDTPDSFGQSAMDVADMDLQPTLKQMRETAAKRPRPNDAAVVNGADNGDAQRTIPPYRRRSSVNRLTNDQRAQITKSEERQLRSILVTPATRERDDSEMNVAEDVVRVVAPAAAAASPAGAPTPAPPAEPAPVSKPAVEPMHAESVADSTPAPECKSTTMDAQPADEQVVLDEKPRETVHQNDTDASKKDQKLDSDVKPASAEEVDEGNAESLEQQRSSWLTEQRKQRRQRLLELYGIADELEKVKQLEQPLPEAPDAASTPAPAAPPTAAPAATTSTSTTAAPAKTTTAATTSAGRATATTTTTTAAITTARVTTTSSAAAAPTTTNTISAAVPATASATNAVSVASRPAVEPQPASAPASQPPSRAPVPAKSSADSVGTPAVLPPASASAPTPASASVDAQATTGTDASEDVPPVSDERRPSNAQVLAPSAQEGTETQRKARAKRARETRRSTQGVTQEDKDEALRTIEQANNRQSANATAASATSSVQPSANATKDANNSTAVSAAATATTQTVGKPNPAVVSATSSATSFASADADDDNTVVMRRRAESNRNADGTEPQSRQGWIRGMRDAKTMDASLLLSSTYDSATLPARLANINAIDQSGDRNSQERFGSGSITGKPSPSAAASAPNAASPHTSASLIRSSSVQRPGSAMSQATSNKPPSPTRRVESFSSVSTTQPPSRPPSAAVAPLAAAGTDTTNNTSGAFVAPNALSSSRMRQRDRRVGPTGNGSDTNISSASVSPQPQQPQLQSASNRFSNRLQFLSGGSAASQGGTQTSNSVAPSVTVTPGRSAASFTGRPLSQTRASSTDVPGGATQVDYKRLYDQECSENARLRHELEELRRQLDDYRIKLQHQQPSVEPTTSSDAVIDRRERRALERRIAECEEELKQIPKLKAENTKIKQENEALIRVISKLTK